LSGGQQRRLEIALGLVGDPDVIFLDEPTTGLDPDARGNIWRLIRQLSEDGKTVILTSHYMDEVEALADRLAIMVDGEICAIGTVAEIIDHYGGHTRFNFSWPHDKLPTDLPTSLELFEKTSENRLTCIAAEPARALTELMDWAPRHNVDLGQLTIKRPSLNDIYPSIMERLQHGDGVGA